VDDKVDIIYQNPLGILISFMPVRYFTANPFYFVLYEIADGFHLNGIGGLANNKKVGHSFGYLPHVKRYYMFTFFFKDGADGRFKQARLFCEP
jgi:hypothetical protein